MITDVITFIMPIAQMKNFSYICSTKKQSMKKYIYGGLAMLILFLLLTVVYTCKDLQKYKELYGRELSNVKAYEAENDSLKSDIRQFQYTMQDLAMSKDTINQKIVEVIREGGIKEKNVERVEYITSVAHKIDTVVFRDTIFKDSTLDVDTVIADDWYKVDLHLQYPSTVVTNPEFKSEKYIIVSTKKEYVKPRSKLFFIRWFQKKRKYVGVDVIEKNPYIDDSISRFIEIVK